MTDFYTLTQRINDLQQEVEAQQELNRDLLQLIERISAFSQLKDALCETPFGTSSTPISYATRG